VVIYFGADHRGFNLKETLKGLLQSEGHQVVDMGNSSYDPSDDYPDFGAAVAGKVSGDPAGSRGVLICGSGVGMDVVANKFPRVRAALGVSLDQVSSARHDDDVNVLVIPADFVAEADAKKMAQVFLATPFAGDERYRRRIAKISKMENE